MRYYVRQSPSDPIRGPFTPGEIQQMLSRGLLTGTAQALLATGQTLFQLRASEEWGAVGALPDVTPTDETEAGDAAYLFLAAQLLSREERLMYWLLGGGVALVILAGLIARLVTPGFSAGGGWGWDTQQLADTTSVVRLLGVLSFAAGLVERLALAIRSRP